MAIGENQTTFDGDPNPSFDCLARGHMWFDVQYDGTLTFQARPYGPRLAAVVAWCPWCSAGAYDPDKYDPDDEEHSIKIKDE